jgi:phosphatidylglycerophosphate synthase
MRAGPTEGWILAGTLDGSPAFPSFDQNVAGMPYVLRLACDLVLAGCRTIRVVWSSDIRPPSLGPLPQDARLRGALLEIVTDVPEGDDTDAIALLRADRIYHRDIPKQAVTAWKDSQSPFAITAGSDAAVVTTRANARTLAAASRTTGWTDALASAEKSEGREPYLSFTTTARDPASLRRAEKTLVWSLRKAADGIASKAINRHLSLPVSWTLMRTSVHPNFITVCCFLLALTGGLTIAQGGYWAGAIGMLIFNLGSIMDGVDGELARLRYQQGRLGQWMDTVADDLGNVAYISGITLNLDAAGVTWAMPVGVASLIAFAITQGGQYALIAIVYKSGDLAAIPWLFQSSDFLSAEKPGVWGTIPKLFKRDFALTMFVVFAFLGWLHVILLIFAASVWSFVAVFAVQFARNARTLRR